MINNFKSIVKIDESYYENYDSHANPLDKVFINKLNLILYKNSLKCIKGIKL
jgi:hypothetical protein